MLTNEEPRDNTPTDREYEELLAKAGSPAVQAEANKVYNDVSKNKELWHRLRVRAKRDLFFLNTSILQYDRLSVNLHGSLCTWMHNTRSERFRLVLLPRGHFKSTVITIADSIRTSLPYTLEDQQYDEELESDPISWPDSLGTDGRIVIAHETHGSACRYLFSVTNHFLTNPILMGLFPDAVPNPRVHTINKESLQLPRTKIWNEPTFDTMGVGAKGQGRHYNKLYLDDLIGDKARDSETEMRTAKEWFDNIQSFFSLFKKDVINMVGTRWSNDDLYQHAMDRYGKKLKTYCRPVEELDPITKVKTPIFPEEFSTEDLNILRKNRRVFSAQYENDPDAGSTKFKADWIKPFTWLENKGILPCGKNERPISVRDLGICFLLDPAVSGLAGFNILGMDHRKRKFILESHQKEWTPPELTEFVFSKVQEYQPRAVAIEEVLFSALFKFWWESEMKLRRIQFRIHPVTTKQKAKDWRVDKLMNPLSAGEFYFNEQFYSVGQDPKGQDSDLIYQIKKYGSIKDIHVLDALAYYDEVAQPGIKREKINQVKAQEDARRKGRSNLTGYSK
jgi:hypothetical protein